MMKIVDRPDVKVSTSKNVLGGYYLNIFDRAPNVVETPGGGQAVMMSVVLTEEILQEMLAELRATEAR